TLGEPRRDEEPRAKERVKDAPEATTAEIKTDQKQQEPASVTQVSSQATVAEIQEKPANPLPSPVSSVERDQSHSVHHEERAASSHTPEPARVVGEQAQTSSFEEFARKWRRYLYPGQLAVMRTLYELTLARGTSECFTQYSQIALATKMTRRNCINVMNSLVERGFVERLEVRNDATGKGIRLRVHPDPHF
ncbi:MAG TPA: hypothetical protein VE732_03525, partial [Nitrososphaera sp.]|nr:hypothetical protein [Nitrososphaera sp.]